MKIISLTAENVKRLRAVEITPAGDIVVIAGRNGQGKTSVLDSIWLALGGAAAAKANSQPIRHGEAGAAVTLDLGELVVTRTWTDGGKSALSVQAADGAAYSSPQRMLDRLVGRLSFDPIAFAHLPARDQRAALLELVQLPFDLDEQRRRRQAWYEERTRLGRDERALAARVAATPLVAGLPDVEVSTASLMAELDQAYSARSVREAARHDSAQAKQTVEDTRRVIADLQAAFDRKQLELAEQLDRQKALADQLHALPEPIDPDAILARLSTVEDTNRAVRAQQDRRQLAEQHAALKAEVEERTAWIDALDDEVITGLAAAKLPLDGLAFADDGLLYAGVPLQQASSAEQLRVSIAVAMALNPQLRVLRISDGSLLDSSNLALIETMAAEHDYQVWIERVDETGQVGILIEDGLVAGRAAVSA